MTLTAVRCLEIRNTRTKTNQVERDTEERRWSEKNRTRLHARIREGERDKVLCCISLTDRGKGYREEKQTEDSSKAKKQSIPTLLLFLHIFYTKSKEREKKDSRPLAQGYRATTNVLRLLRRRRQCSLFKFFYSPLRSHEFTARKFEAGRKFGVAWCCRTLFHLSLLSNCKFRCAIFEAV